METLIRFVIGGAVVSGFALIGGLFRPTSFAGLFGAAPSVALVTLGLAIAKEGKNYASVECRSMIAGAFALCAYSLVAAQLLLRFKLSALTATALSTVPWFLVAFSLWQVFLR